MPEPLELAALYLTPRAKELQRVESYVKGTQYSGRVDWFDNSSSTPLFERKPCVNYPIAKSAIGSHVAFVLGEGRWPSLTSGTSEDDQAVDDDWGLSEDQSDALDRFVNVVLIRHARVKEVAREMLSDAMGCRSVAVVVSIKSGRLRAETVKASWCTPTLNDNDECVSLEIRYPYVETFYNDQARRYEQRCMLYRRIIDAVSDTVYVPAKAKEDGTEPSWSVDASKTKAHGLGFCPAIWYPFLKPCSTVDVVDGVAIHEGQLGEIDCLNIALSQKQRAAVTAGDPQMFETGVADDVNPAPVGQQARGVISSVPDSIGADGKKVTLFSTTARRGLRAMARKRGAGVIWRYPDSASKVGYLTIPGDALKAVDDHARDLRGKIAEALSAVFVDAGELKMHAAMSGKALAFLFARQLGFCDGVRSDFADKALLPLVSMLLRVVFVVGSKSPRAIYMPGVAKILPVLASFERESASEDGTATGARVWVPPRIEPAWGPYFPPNEQDQLFVVQLAVAALTGGIATTEMAVEKLRDGGVFELGSAAEVVEGIAKERADKQAEAVAQAGAMAAVAPPVPPGQPGKPDAPKPAKQAEKEAA